MGKPIDETFIEKNQNLINDAYKIYGFNQYLSDQISFKRTLPDVRNLKCQQKNYSKINLKVSVIIVFYDEGMSTLARTIYSVIDRSPNNLLYEIILVDDYSTLSHLKNPLDNWIKKFNGKVKLIRMSIHEGLITARNIGASAANGDVLLFLDSHCEVTKGWLEPLIDPINQNYKIVTAPIIDVIDHKTFEYRTINSRTRGTFSWLFYYKEKDEQILINKNKFDYSTNIKSPVMAGGLFAISKKWWNELGQYDPELFVWGGEQYEISFKIWMCGGQLLNIPCSHVGHIYRGPGMIRNQQNIHIRHPNSLMVNYKRVAEVWMDEFKNFLYMNHRGIANADIGKDLNKRILLRKSLNCKNFDWYLRNIIKDTLYTRYEPDLAYGLVSITDENNIKLCACNYGMNNPIYLIDCKSCDFKWRYTWIREFKEDEHCWDYNPNLGYILNKFCHENKGNQHFYYDKLNKLIKMDINSNYCIMADKIQKKLVRYLCYENKPNLFKFWNLELIDNSNTPPEWSKLAIHPPR